MITNTLGTKLRTHVLSKYACIWSKSRNARPAYQETEQKELKLRKHKQPWIQHECKKMESTINKSMVAATFHNHPKPLSPRPSSLCNSSSVCLDPLLDLPQCLSQSGAREQRLFGPSDSPGLATGSAKIIAIEVDLVEGLVVFHCIG